ncbi:3083_t:CDS:2 [Funneliformis caledonium]|uniref:3083_t:CDS:1 n=1 Tax=Funneliformis caledonium TaxID=1117310 RepID=A0A9N8Z520_9GLOM|nr:3083_t:CDS:2 [Funneliformis caledonium]
MIISSECEIGISQMLGLSTIPITNLTGMNGNNDYTATIQISTPAITPATNTIPPIDNIVTGGSSCGQSSGSRVNISGTRAVVGAITSVIRDGFEEA